MFFQLQNIPILNKQKKKKKLNRKQLICSLKILQPALLPPIRLPLVHVHTYTYTHTHSALAREDQFAGEEKRGPPECDSAHIHTHTHIDTYIYREVG